MLKLIAEFCQNHNGDVSVLQEMIHQAAEAGATHAKIQTIFADDIVYRPEFEEGETREGQVLVIKRPYRPEYERLKGLELSYEQQSHFVRDCGRFGLIPLTTCFTRGSIPRLVEAGFKQIKVASYDCASLPMIRELAERFEQMIVSTGATHDEEIEKTCDFLNSSGVPFALLHCVTLYPTPLTELHLNRMAYLRKFTPEVGVSEHTNAQKDGIKATLAAIYLGATWIERHYRSLAFDRSRDGLISIDQAQLKEVVAFSRLSKSDQKQQLAETVPEFEKMLGSEKRGLSAEELRNRAYYRGRFATHLNGRPIYNWQEEILK